jgi:hypothetical protein
VDLPGVNAQEKTKTDLIESLRIGAQEMLAMEITFGPDALVVFQVDGEESFNNWHKEMSLRNREADQTIMYIHVKKWRQHSAIEGIRVAVGA